MRRGLALAILACAVVSCASRPPSSAVVQPQTLPEFRDGHPFVAAERIRIDAPRDSVWAMLSASRRARQWSVIVHHIDVLSGRDGVVGTVRRCYLCPSGTFDERVVALAPPSYRLSFGPLDPIVNACYARPRLRQVLARNLANMKALVETGERYRRVYRFEGDEARCPEARGPS